MGRTGSTGGGTDGQRRGQRATDPSADQLLSILLLEDDPRPMQYAIIATCAFFIALFLVTFPEGERKTMDVPVIYVPDLETYVPPVKEMPPQPLERQVVEKVRKVALPDPTPEEPEPIREPLPEPEPPPIPPNAVVLRGLPPRPPRMPPPASAPVDENTAGLTRPVVKKAPVPVYPPLAIRARFEGEVVIRAIIGTDGRVKHAEVEQSVGRFGMDEAALQAAKARVYTPGVLNGKPVEVITRIRYPFTLE
jgi:TonB family protein